MPATASRLGKILGDARRAAGARDGDAASHRGRARRYIADPVGYAGDVLGVSLTPQQQQIARALLEPPYRVLVPSANNTGKTFLAATLASWFHDNFTPSIVQATAPTARQVHDLLFKELRGLRGNVAGASAGFAPKADRLERSPAHFVNGFTARDADSFQGTHAEFLGLVFDEATGIDDEFWRRAATMWNGDLGHWWLAIYNPNDAGSPAYAAEESGLWRVIRLSALEHPNLAAELRGEPPPVPSAIRLRGVLARIKSECEPVAASDADPLTDFLFPPAASPAASPVVGEPQWYRPKTPAFEAQVLGRWPLIPTQGLFSPALVDKCAAASRHVEPDWMPQVGVDVARFGGDKSAIAVRRGPCLLHVETHSRRDTAFLALRIRELLEQFAIQIVGYDKRGELISRIPVVVDGTGGYGGGVVDQLPGCAVADLSMSAASPDPRVLRMRSYLWFRLAELAHAGLLDLSRLDADTLRQLRGDLVAPRYRIDEQNRKVLEPKHQIKDRLGRSPDVGDAVALAYYTG